MSVNPDIGYGATVTFTNLPDGTSQEVFYASDGNPAPAALFTPGEAEVVDNYSGPNETGTLQSAVNFFANGDAVASFFNQGGNTALVGATYSGTGMAFLPGAESDLNAALGTNAFAVATTNPTISELVGSYSGYEPPTKLGGSGSGDIIGPGILTGAFVNYTNGTSAIVQDTPSGQPAQTDYSGPNGSGTVLGVSYYGIGTDLGAALTIAVTSSHF